MLSMRMVSLRLAMNTVLRSVIFLFLIVSRLEGCCREGRLKTGGEAGKTGGDGGNTGGDGGKTGRNAKCFVQKLGSYSWSEDICEHALQELNKFRRLHQDTPDVILNQTLNQKALDYAVKTVVTRDGHDYKNLAGLGETISDAAIQTGKGSDLTNAIKDRISYCLSDMYTKEKQYYEQPLDPGEDLWLHYVQMVWKSAVSIGVGVAIGHRHDWSFRLVLRFYPGVDTTRKGLAENVMPTIKR